MQAVSLRGLEEEQEILVKGRGDPSSPYSSRLAAAVSLSSGEVLVTGGRGRDRQMRKTVTVLLVYPKQEMPFQHIIKASL